MALTNDLAGVLKRNAHLTESAQVLAVLAKAKTRQPAARSWLAANASPEIVALISSDASWRSLCDASSKYLSLSASVAHRNAAKRVISHVLRNFDATPSAARKARLVAAICGAALLADEQGRDTWVGSAVELGAMLNVTEKTASAMLTNAVRLGVLKERGRTRTGSRRFALRRWPTSHKPSAVEAAASASILAGEPNALAQWVLSAGHPAWHYDTLRLTPTPAEEAADRQSPKVFTLASWEDMVFRVAGLRRQTRAYRGLAFYAPTPEDLDLRLDAVARAGVAALERRAAAATRLAEAERSRADREVSYQALRGMGWAPKVSSFDLDPWLQDARLTLTRFPPPAEFWKTAERELKRHFPDRAADALSILKEDIFDDRNTAA